MSLLTGYTKEAPASPTLVTTTWYHCPLYRLSTFPSRHSQSLAKLSMGWRVLDSVLYLLCSVAPSGGLGAAAGGERAAGVGLDLLVRKLHWGWMLASLMLLRTRLRDAVLNLVPE